ncbi:MAG: hypothetical protein BWY76_00417 [bacterium ADurb.Bin429]|nr:MAG: hypothetical protein BWY76_00417 [bacterium ADurb.Bin429]
MTMLGMILWVLFVLWMLHLAVPNAFMRARVVYGLYYLVWALLLGIALTIHYHIMAHTGHAQQAITSDGIAVALFVVTHLGLRCLKHPGATRELLHKEEQQDGAQRL